MDALQELKLLTEEREGTADSPVPRAFTDEDLTALLALHEGDVRGCAYDVLVRKAENTQITLPDGTVLPDQSKHFLRLAASLRRSVCRNMPRADDVPPTPPDKGGTP